MQLCNIVSAVGTTWGRADPSLQVQTDVKHIQSFISVHLRILSARSALSIRSAPLVYRSYAFQSVLQDLFFEDRCLEILRRMNLSHIQLPTKVLLMGRALSHLIILVEIVDFA